MLEYPFAPKGDARTRTDGQFFLEGAASRLAALLATTSCLLRATALVCAAVPGKLSWHLKVLPTGRLSDSNYLDIPTVSGARLQG